MKLIVVIFATLLLIVTSEAQTCTPIQGCDVTRNGSCYAYVGDNINWNQAENCCVTWGGHLASIHSNDANVLLKGIRNQSRHTWIGLSDTASDGVYVWTDGTPFDYENFESGQPDSLNGESCFHFRHGGALTWNDYFCNNNSFKGAPASYICQKRIFTTVCENTVISNGGDTGGICYEESFTTDMLDWYDASLNCSGTNRRLANALNEEMSVELERVTEDTDEYWIGLSRQNSSSDFIWSDGSSLSYTRWSSGHPIDGLNCVSVRGNGIEWYSRNCNDNISYVCEKDVCVDWVIRNGICYKKLDSTVAAAGALAMCESQNAYLAEIPNIYVDNIITEIVRGDGYRYWTGLKTNDTGYYWRIGDFPLGNDTLDSMDRNMCGNVISGAGNRWILRGCGNFLLRRAFCMKGPLTNEFPTERCENSSADTLVYEDSCYTLITVHKENLDRATLTCTDYYNGTLYGLDNDTLNMRIRDEFGNGSNLSVVDPTLYSRYTPQDGYFNLYTSNDDMNYPDNPNCVGIESNGMLSSSNCPEDDQTNYICKRAIIQTRNMPTSMPTSMLTSMLTSMPTSMLTSMPTSILTSMPTSILTSMLTSMPTRMPTTQPPVFTELNCSKNSTTPVCVSLLSLTYDLNMETNTLIQKENLLESLNEEIMIETGQFARVLNRDLGAEIVVTSVDSSINTTVSFEGVTVQINDQSFENDSIVTSAVYEDSSEFIGAANIVSFVITIIASETLKGNLTIIFTLNDQNQRGTLICSSYTNNSKWVSEGITTSEMENGIECVPEHLTTFAVTIVITIDKNEIVNCSDPVQNNTTFCDIIDEIPTYQSEKTSAVRILQEVDLYLRDLVLSLNITTGIILEITQPQNVLVIIGLRQNSTTSVPVGENVVTTNPNSFPDDTVLVVLSITLNDTTELTNDSVRIVSDIIIIQASNDLNGNLTIQFIVRNELKLDIPENSRLYCAFLDSDGTWSRSGITTTVRINNNIDCVTEHLTPFALLSTTSICDVDVGSIHIALLQAASYTLLSVSLLFLFASIVSFLISWKKVFHIDINILNFHHSIALFLAIFVTIFGTETFSRHRTLCHIVAFLWHLLWTNVFLSSLSISILVFYSILIAGFKHPAKKLSFYLIPFTWTISVVWTLVWLAYGLVKDNYINKRDNPDCEQPCTLSTQSYLVYALIVPVVVIIVVNLFILFLILLKIRRVFKNKDRDEKELVRLRRVAFGGLLLVPSLGLPFLLSIPLSFSYLYRENIPLYLFFQWTSLISTATIGILHFFLVTYQTPEVKQSCIRSNTRNQQIHTTDTSLPSSPPISHQIPAPLKLNVVKHKVDDYVIKNEHTGSVV